MKHRFEVSWGLGFALWGSASIAGAGWNAPEWLTSPVYDEYGQQDRVLLPWTPVECGNREVRVWGRVMRWTEGSLLPSSITSQGQELLAAPMQLWVGLGGREQAVPLDSFEVLERRASRATFRATGTVEGLRFTTEIWVEYDGFLWVTLQAEVPEPDRPVEGLRIVVGLDRRRTPLYQTFARRLAGFIGDDPLPLPWLADPAEGIVNFYHWLGNEDGGLGFTYTSLEHWAPHSEEAFCRIIPAPDTVWYQINLAEKPVQLEGRVYRFGIQATPIKPLPPDYHSMVSAAAQWAPWKAWQQIPENLDDVVIWPPGIMQGLNNPYHVNAEGLRSQVQEVHARRVAVVFTGCPQKVSPGDDWFEDWRLEWITWPESILEWDGVPHWQNCGRSYALRKWLFHGWTQLVQRFGLDGIYWDGWQTGQIACTNSRHGCGWTDEHGKRHRTVPVLEGREFNQRMAAFLEDHVHSIHRPATAPERPGFPRYIWRIHSWEFVPSVMGFATSWLTGEFAAYPLEGPSMLTPEGTLGKSLGLGLLRARCLSTNWGVPNQFHLMMWEHTENHPTDRQTLSSLAWLLPHGIPLGELAYLNQKTYLEIARILMAFRTRQARFIPAWRPNPYLAIEGPKCPEVMVATWDHHPEPQVLAVVSNLKVDEGQEAALRWTGFAGPQVVEARSGQPVPLVDGRLRLRLGPESFVLLRLEK